MSNKETLERLKNDIKLRGLSQNTLEEYVDRVRIFMSYFERPVEQLNEDDIKEFLLYLKEERELKNASINTYNSAIRFLFGVTLNKPLNIWQIPRFKQSRDLPQLLTQQEIALLLEHTPNPMYRALFMTIYGSGLRVSEAVNIKVCDIDSEKMRIFIRKGKGGKDRFAALSQKALEELRSYWKIKRPTDFLFLTRENTNPSPHSVNNAFHASMNRAGIGKKATSILCGIVSLLICLKMMQIYFILKNYSDIQAFVLPHGICTLPTTPLFRWLAPLTLWCFPMIELQDIIQVYGEDYAKQHSMLHVQHKALRDIRDCRTAALGGHIDHYDCGHTHISYNSCRNRNCPKEMSENYFYFSFGKFATVQAIFRKKLVKVIFGLFQSVNRLQKNVGLWQGWKTYCRFPITMWFLHCRKN